MPIQVSGVVRNRRILVESDS